MAGCERRLPLDPPDPLARPRSGLALVNSLLKTGLWGPSKSGARPLNRHESALSAADYDRIAAVLW